MLAILASVTFFFASAVETVYAASSWNPTLLVNTESFQTIDSGDQSTPIELRFGQTDDRRIFWNRTGAGTGTLKFTRGAYIQGNLTVTGTLLSVKGVMSGARLRVDGGAAIWGNLSVTGTTLLQGNTKVRGSLSGATLRVDSNADIWGTLSATGSIKSHSGLVINSRNAASDALLEFGNATTVQSLRLSNANQRFEFSTSVSTKGTMSGYGLRVDGNADIWGHLGVSGSTMFNRVNYTWPSADGSANTFLKTNGAGTLSWAASTIGPSSGELLSLHPEFPNSVYFQSGSTAVGSLTYASSGATDNYYRWATTRNTLQDYWISTRVRIPKNFSHFETASGMQIRLRTGTTHQVDNYITVRLIDTAGASVALTNNASMTGSIANGWRTNTISNLNAGTYTALGYITVLVKLAATSVGFTDLGFINLNYSNTTP